MFSHPGLEQTGQKRPGSKDSELEGCTVQPLQCKKCRESVGVKCTSVPPDKEMHRYVRISIDSDLQSFRCPRLGIPGVDLSYTNTASLKILVNIVMSVLRSSY